MTDTPIRYRQAARQAVKSLREYAARPRTEDETAALNKTVASDAWDQGFETAISIFDLITGEDPAVARARLKESDV